MELLLNSFGMVGDAVKGDRLSAAELAAAAHAGAGRLASLGAGPDHPVIISHGGTPRFFADLFAVWTAGAAAACINPGTTISETERLIDFLRPAAILVDGDGEGSISGCPVVDLSGSVQTDAPVLAPSALDDDALILFTSGTTGEPKGIALSFRAVLARVALNAAHIGRRDLSAALCVLPTHFGHGLIGNCLTPLLSGCNLVLAPGNDLKSVAQFGQILDDNAITFMSSVPAFWKLALKVAKPPGRESLRRVHIGSAPLSADLWRSVRDWSGANEVVNMYGLTETANWVGGASCACHEPEDGLIGAAWGGRMAVRQDGGVIANEGEGELIVQTPSLMKGYLRRPDLTAQILENGWLRTGDIGRIGPDGTARLAGRQKYEINRAGIKVHPEDIDILLERHPDVSEACAFAVQDSISGEVVGVAVVPRNDTNFDLQALREWTGQHLVSEKVPVKWYVVPEIKKNDRGKINRDTIANACAGLQQ